VVIPLISLKAIKDRLGYSDTDNDPDLYSALLQAQKIIVDYLEVADDAYDTDLPKHIEVAILLVLDCIKNRPGVDPIPDNSAVASLLRRTRLPTVV
jgi:hypothetical protein